MLTGLNIQLIIIGDRYNCAPLGRQSIVRMIYTSNTIMTNNIIREEESRDVVFGNIFNMLKQIPIILKRCEIFHRFFSPNFHEYIFKDKNQKSTTKSRHRDQK